MPGMTSRFRASTARAAVPAIRGATCAILPSFTATSWTPSIPEAGSMTRPPRTIRSNFAIASLLVRDRLRHESLGSAFTGAIFRHRLAVCNSATWQVASPSNASEWIDSRFLDRAVRPDYASPVQIRCREDQDDGLRDANVHAPRRQDGRGGQAVHRVRLPGAPEGRPGQEVDRLLQGGH